jgi:hypothetical protein
MSKKNQRRRPPAECPVCGEEVPPRALACPECGADHESGWKDEVNYDGLDLPDEEFDYDEFVDREFGGGERVKRPKIGWLWWIVGLLLLLGMILGSFRIFN